MPLPDRLARFNRSVGNRLMGPLATRLPGFAIVVHRGRRSGRRYRTPVSLFRSGTSYVVALTYGRDRDWVKNVLAAGGCEVLTRGTIVRLEQPRIVLDRRLTLVPVPLRPILKMIGANAVLLLRPVTAPHRDGGRVGFPQVDERR